MLCAARVRLIYTFWNSNSLNVGNTSSSLLHIGEKFVGPNWRVMVEAEHFSQMLILLIISQGFSYLISDKKKPLHLIINILQGGTERSVQLQPCQLCACIYLKGKGSMLIWVLNKEQNGHSLWKWTKLPWNLHKCNTANWFFDIIVDTQTIDTLGNMPPPPLWQRLCIYTMMLLHSRKWFVAKYKVPYIMPIEEEYG